MKHTALMIGLIISVTVLSAQTGLILNGVDIFLPVGYKYLPSRSNNDQVVFSKQSTELIVNVYDTGEEQITENRINQAITAGNELISWKLAPKIKRSNGDSMQSAIAVNTPSEKAGYRLGFIIDKNKLVIITAYADNSQEASETALQTSINIDKNN
jgi:hypothetical protein